jgi:2-polyprenyl-6-methoxyphenol hydroxylase-like FAD-dependent oxidoreductase
MDETKADVAIVGGGIAGGALAVRLARAGLAVTVLEQSAEFRDRVRGETMFPWGCAELVESGLLAIAMRAEGTIATRVVPYGDSMSPHDAEAAAGLAP